MESKSRQNDVEPLINPAVAESALGIRVSKGVETLSTLPSAVAMGALMAGWTCVVIDNLGRAVRWTGFPAVGD
jgi:hypothetical protein